MQSTPLSSPRSSPTRSYAYEDNILADYNTTTTTAYVSDTTDNTTASITNSTIIEHLTGIHPRTFVEIKLL